MTITLTKSQRRRRNAKLRMEQQERWDKEVGRMPKYPKKLLAALGENTNYKEAWQRAPLHVLDHDLQQIDKGKQASFSAAAGQLRSKERDLRIAEVRSENRDLWFRRGGARLISKRWNRLHPDDPISVRTVQTYVRSTKNIAQAPRVPST